MAELRDQLQETLGDSLILEQELGGGGMSRVFVAHESALGRKVVVKVLPPEMAAAVSIDRFRREIQLAAQLQHPHIVPLLSAGDTNGLPYFTMPYVRGDSLRARLKSGELPVAETLRILREVASALAYAHENHIVHRDIKPENVLISGGSAVVTDFGVAKALSVSSGATESSLTSLGVALGTPAYMSPEQATADPNIDHRADIYALGVMAYEMLTGSTPFQGRSPQATLAAHVTEAPELITKRRSAVSPGLATLVMRCLEKRAADRPQTATQLMHELDALTTPSGGTTPTLLMPVVRTSSMPARGLAIGVGVLLLAVLGFIGAKKFSLGSAGVPAAAVMPAIAVLPFENVGRAEGKEFTDGMTEEITNKLASIRGLRVIGRQSAMTYAGSTKTPQVIANELGVKYLLTGTVRWDKATDGKDIVRVSPALLRSDDATQVWGDAYQTVMAGVFEIQSKVATDVANALNVKLVAPERTALAEKPTANEEAYALFLRGNELVRVSTQIEQLREGVSLLERATSIDPKFAIAWARLSHGHTELHWFKGDRRADRLKKAKAAVDKALSINPNLPEAHLALGVWYYHGYRNYDKAISEFAIAAVALPNDPVLATFQGAIQRRMGQWDASTVNFRRAVELEPRATQYLTNLAGTFLALGDSRQAESLAERATIIDPTMPNGYKQKATSLLELRDDVEGGLSVLRQMTQRTRNRQEVVSTMFRFMWATHDDPEFRRMMVDARYTPDFGRRGYFMLRKTMLFRLLGDSARMRSYADSAASDLTSELKDPTQDGHSYADLSLVEAVRGNRSAALAAGATAGEMLSLARDAYDGAYVQRDRVAMYILLGDHGSAVKLMEEMRHKPGQFVPSYLRRDPFFNPLRSNPGFQKIING